MPTTTQTTKNNQIRILGTDPATGHTVKARIGRYGPMVEIEGNEGEKSRFASLKKGQLIESLTLEEALEYIEDDELVEVTPQSIRMRKRLLSATDRRKANKN